MRLSACQRHEYLSRNYWYCILRQIGADVFHPMCTCPMGTDRKTSVVGPDLRVHGIKKLRVVDASVIPTAMSGHPYAVVIMMAEKISREIKMESGTWCV